ncbi:hypothetical protein Mchl_1648 [Methylorubrum extorquens CM4]|uniref:Uncharacterized protein n=2 Tax=Methylorubrum extorquens TaxID=408 RepID=B7KTI4_METC4|nr:hypothetical protein Mchl_1648 [Methylorubrum extorquens CM4]
MMRQGARGAHMGFKNVRHQMAQAFTQMQMMGYSALQNYGVNYQELPAYEDPGGLLEKAGKAPPRRPGGVLRVHAPHRRRGSPQAVPASE